MKNAFAVKPYFTTFIYEFLLMQKETEKNE